ncbi:MAG: hypothetical protein JWO71_3402 [Candidatus Acidoferrum typicum]|nr:hypothetical protein [Candidatus Acidoferrum typicum]
MRRALSILLLLFVAVSMPTSAFARKAPLAAKLMQAKTVYIQSDSKSDVRECSEELTKWGRLKIVSGIYDRTIVYSRVTSMDDFEPWLSRLESKIDIDAIWRMAQGIPSAWYWSQPTSLARLIERLDRRRSRVRELLLQPEV